MKAVKPAGPIVRTKRLRAPLPDAVHPGAVWAAFARQGRWKDLVLLVQCAALALLLALNLRLSLRPPDVVVVDEEGRGTYVERRVASAALLDFLQIQHSQPGPATVRAFARDFLSSALELNGAGADASWSAALQRMAPPLRERMDAQLRTGEVLERAKRLRVWTRVAVTVFSVEPRGAVFVVRARVARALSIGADDASSKRDSFDTELVLGVVPRTALNPDGLEVMEWRLQSLPSAEGASTPPPEGDGHVDSSGR